MEIKVIENVDNKLLGRKEVSFLATYGDKTISMDEAKTEICKKLGLKPENTVINRIDQKFGLKQSMIRVYSYQNKEAMDRYERKYLTKRLEKKAKSKDAEAQKEAQ
ncbi:30S ribosomal protein S24e [mine drainage metagenome]|uniref:30S ribosomal protein S24e n=1 Tax=mine drainage metagenome TaxID=410659 RepID=T1AVZ5_9ZZZZ